MSDEPALPQKASDASRARQLLRRLPGGRRAEEEIERIERRVLRELKSRLDRVEPAASVSVVALSVQTRADRPHEPGNLLRGLLDAAREQSRAAALDAWYARVLRGLVPDEARILAALSGDAVYPLINVVAIQLLGVGGSRPVLENVSSVGRAAGVMAPELTHLYVRHLRSYGLVELDGEAPAQALQYEMLESDSAVRAAITKLQRANQRAQVQRRTLRMSELGNALWAACRISEDQP